MIANPYDDLPLHAAEDLETLEAMDADLRRALSLVRERALGLNRCRDAAEECVRIVEDGMADTLAIARSWARHAVNEAA